jgi:hypothetical protein
MEREVFVLRNGDSFFAWNVQLGARKEHRETLPCFFDEPDGTRRRGTYSYTVESARISFCAPPASVHVGEWGQLSSAAGHFYDVKVSFIELAEGHVVVTGDATRQFGYEEKR